MVKCPSCGAVVGEGKFCEKCGSPLAGATPVSGNEVNTNQAPVNNSNVNNSVGGFFNKINASVNKAATDLMAIKSDFSNATIICMVNKIPNVQEKKIRVNDDEVLYYNNGNGYELHNATFTVTDNIFICFYIKNQTLINNNVNFSIKTKIKCLNDTDEMNVNISYDICFRVIDIDTFFHKLISIRQDTFRVIDVNSMLSENLRKIIIGSLTEQLANDGNLDLRDVRGQLNKFSENIKNLINEEVKSYGMEVNSFNLSNSSTDITEINNILIKNLYKEASNKSVS